MATQPFDDSEYPYAAKPPVLAAKARQPMWRIPWGLIHHLLWRALAMVVVALPIAAIGLGIVAYRARRQAAIVAELSNHGLYYVHWHRYDDYEDRVPAFLRKWFGDDFWNDIAYINGHAESVEATNAFCEAFGKLTRLRGIGITSKSLTLDQLSEWPHFLCLQEVAIWSPLIADEQLAQIAKITTIRKLSLDSPKITNAGLQHLTALTQLESLELRGAKFSDGGLPNERGFPHLKELKIADSPELNDNAILNLGPMPELHEVEITECLIGDRSLAHLASGGGLYSLTLNHTQVGDLGMAALANCQDLGNLELNNTKVTDEGLKSLAATQLSIVSLENTAITDEGFKILMEIPRLTFLSLRDTRIAGVGARFRREGESVELVDLAGCPVTPDGIAALANAKFSYPFGATTSLRLDRTPLTDKELMLFVENDEVENLSVSETRVTATGVKNFHEARKRRLEGTGQKEGLTLSCDFPDVVEPYLPKENFSLIDGSPLDVPPPDAEPPSAEQPTPPEQAAPAPSQP